MAGQHFELEVETDAAARTARFQLRDAHGQPCGAHQVRFEAADAARWEGLFDTRSHVERYERRPGFDEQAPTAEELLAQLGVFLGERVLGAEIASRLADGVHDRTLLVRLPLLSGEEKEDLLVAAFARVPWEIARPAVGEAPLLERNLVVRVVTADIEAASWTAPAPAKGEPLRVLLVFAEAPGSRPLAMRLEREMLLELFYEKVLPYHQVRVDTLCHGVSRAQLREQVENAGGYHLVHWSGHGHHDLLELYGEDGRSDQLSGQELLGLFAEAGGFLPHLVFLSACLSGTFVGSRDWQSLRAALTGAGVRHGGTAELARVMDQRPGYAGTALALLRAGVPQAIAMRYEVGDAYARDLARGFYERLLTQQERKSAAKALALAWAALWRDRAPGHTAVDHATPLVLGRDMAPFELPRGRSPQLGERRPQPQPLLPGGRSELDRPAAFVGRGGVLTELRGQWLIAGAPAVTVIQGLAGLGKTALVAETIHLWHRQFEGVFAFQSKPTPLTVDDFLRRLDERLTLHSGAYRELCDRRPNRRFCLPSGAQLEGDRRFELLRDNLLEALRDERLLLVLDNFETQLEAVAGEDGYSCADPQWDLLLAHLAKGLPETGSRLVLTSRHRLAVLQAPEMAMTEALGPLPVEEAVLFLQGSPALRRLASGDDSSWALARRLLDVSRGHPLILTRLGALAGDWQALDKALTELENLGFARLSDIFTERLSAAEREAERQYLDDVAAHSVDLLLKRLTPDARRLLWVVTRALEPVPKAVLDAVWPAHAPPPALLLEELLKSGLLAPESEHAVGFHELMRERATAWVNAHPEDGGERTEVEIWRAYGERYKAEFEDFILAAGEPGAKERAAEAGRLGIAYFVRARAFRELGSFASWVVTGTHNPVILWEVIRALESVEDQVPPGRSRWLLRLNLADALQRVERPDAALTLYEQAKFEAEAAKSWRDVASICQNWSGALRKVGRIDAALATSCESVAADRRAGSLRVNAVGNELERLRTMVSLRDVEHALPEIESRLAEVRAWWHRHRDGKPVPEASAADVGRIFVVALYIAIDANFGLERWLESLDLIDELEMVQCSRGEEEQELAQVRFKRYGPFLRLGRLDEALDVLEGCLRVFRDGGDQPRQAKVLAALASLWKERGDCNQAVALAWQALAFSNRIPDLEFRSVCHNDLSNILDQLGEDVAASQHQLAAIVYSILISNAQHAATVLNNVAIDIHRSASFGVHYELPRLAEILVLPGFAALRQELDVRNVDLGELEAAVDQLVNQVRAQMVLAPPVRDGER